MVPGYTSICFGTGLWTVDKDEDKKPYYAEMKFMIDDEDEDIDDDKKAKLYLNGKHVADVIDFEITTNNKCSLCEKEEETEAITRVDCMQFCRDCWDRVADSTSSQKVFNEGIHCSVCDRICDGSNFRIWRRMEPIDGQIDTYHYKSVDYCTECFPWNWYRPSDKPFRLWEIERIEQSNKLESHIYKFGLNKHAVQTCDVKVNEVKGKLTANQMNMDMVVKDQPKGKTLLEIGRCYDLNDWLV